MQSSAELEQVMYQMADALSRADHNFSDRWISQHPGVLTIGTDPREWWEGQDTNHKAFKTQFAELGQSQFEVEKLRAYAQGDCGWGVLQGMWTFPDKSQVFVRQSFVFVQEDGGWRWVHLHASVGVGNQEAIGKELTTG